jgi:MinD-like ATPase involved in chromosome partitioning or flagellar assembly
MLVFSVSDKGGTGRSVTSTNLAYRAALLGYDTVYLDFDFGSPTVGAIFDVDYARNGVRKQGLHDYLYGESNEPLRIDIWTESTRENITRPLGARALVLMPGSLGGSEFLELDEQMVQRCADLFLRLHEEFEVCVVDLSAGRSAAMDLAGVPPLDAAARHRRGQPRAR